MAVAIARAPFNSLPHIDALIKSGVRSVRKDLPMLPSTYWSLKHKHFDLNNEEVLLFKVLTESIEVSVVKYCDTTDLYPCQAFYIDGNWKIIGYSATKCQLTIPKYEGTGMVTAIFKKGRWMEHIRLEERTQTFTKWDGSLILGKDKSVIITGVADKDELECIGCTRYIREHK